MKKFPSPKIFLVFMLSTMLSTSTLSKSDEPEVLTEAFNHLTYHLALLHEGFNPNDVKSSMSDTLVLERVPSEFIPLYKQFYELTDELSVNFQRINQEKKSIERANTQTLSDTVNSTVALGTKLIAASTDPTGISGLSLLSSLLGQSEQNRNITESESLLSYQNDSNKLLAAYEFELRVSRKFVPANIPENQKLSINDAREFIGIQRNNDNRTHAELIKLKTRNHALHPLLIAIAYNELALKDYKSAISHFESALGVMPSILNNHEVEAEIYETLVVGLIASKGDGDKIEQYSKKLSKLDPLNPVSLFVEGISAFGEKDENAGLQLLRKSIAYNNDKPFMAGLNVLILCNKAQDKDCKLAIDKGIELGIKDYSELVPTSVKKKLLQALPETYYQIFGLKFSIGFDWHLINPDQIIITNTSSEEWTNIVAGSTFNEYGGQTFRPSQDYWYSYKNVKPGGSLSMLTATSTRKKLEKVTIQLWTEQGNAIISLKNQGKGVFGITTNHGNVEKAW